MSRNGISTFSPMLRAQINDSPKLDIVCLCCVFLSNSSVAPAWGKDKATELIVALLGCAVHSLGRAVGESGGSSAGLCPQRPHLSQLLSWSPLQM